MQEHIGEDPQSAIARCIVVLVPEDRSVNLGLGRLTEGLRLLFRLRGQFVPQRVDVLLDARLYALQQAERLSVLAVRIILIRHFVCPIDYADKYAPGSLKRLDCPFGHENSREVSTMIWPSGASSTCARSIGRGAGPSKFIPSLS